MKRRVVKALSTVSRLRPPKRYCSILSNTQAYTSNHEDEFENLRKDTRTAWARRPATSHMVIALTKQIKEVGRARDWRKAIGILREIESRGLEPSVVTYNAVIKVLRESHCSREINKLIMEMGSKKIEFDAGTYCEVITMCGYEKKMSQALEYFQEAVERKLDNPVVYGAMLNACASNVDFNIGIHVFKQLKDSYNLINDVHYVALFRLAGRAKQVEFATRLRDQYIASHFTTIPVWTTLLDCFIICDRPDLFWDSLQKFHQSGHESSIYIYREIIDACENFQDVESAKPYFQELSEKHPWSFDRASCVASMLKLMKSVGTPFEEVEAYFTSVPMEFRTWQLYDAALDLCFTYQRWALMDKWYTESLENPIFLSKHNFKTKRDATRPLRLETRVQEGHVIDCHRYRLPAFVAAARRAIFHDNVPTLTFITGHGKYRETSTHGVLKKRTLEWLRSYLPAKRDEFDGWIRINEEEIAELRLVLPQFDVDDLVDLISN